MRELTQLKAAYPEYKQVYVPVLQNVIKKLQRSFENMWERDARRVVEVDARYTSRECPACGTRKKKSLSERTHQCSECGLVLRRDTAAAQGILGRMCPSDAKIGEVVPCLV
jgi:transposase